MIILLSWCIIICLYSSNVLFLQPNFSNDDLIFLQLNLSYLFFFYIGLLSKHQRIYHRTLCLLIIHLGIEMTMEQRHCLVILWIMEYKSSVSGFYHHRICISFYFTRIWREDILVCGDSNLKNHCGYCWFDDMVTSLVADVLTLRLYRWPILGCGPWIFTCGRDIDFPYGNSGFSVCCGHGPWLGIPPQNHWQFSTSAGTESRKGGNGSQRHHEEKNGVPWFGLMYISMISSPTIFFLSSSCHVRKYYRGWVGAGKKEGRLDGRQSLVFSFFLSQSTYNFCNILPRIYLTEMRRGCPQILPLVFYKLFMAS